MEGLTIQIGWEYFLGIFFFLLAIAWYTQGRFTKLEISMEWVKRMISQMKTDSIADEVAPPGSPRRLNDRGRDILEKSGIKEIIDEKKPDLAREAKGARYENSYDAEQGLVRIVGRLTEDKRALNKLKKGAFNVGTDIDTVLFVGAIYLRDLIFDDLGFKISDIDRHDPAQ